MRIAVDGSAIPRSMAGAGVYTYQLVRALSALPEAPEICVFAREGLFEDVNVRVVRTRQMSPAARFVWEQASLPLLLRRLGVDVLHSPHHHTPVLARVSSGGRTKRVVTIHDVTFMLLPERYPVVRRLYMEGVTRASARLADAVIVPSVAVRSDTARALGHVTQLSVVPEAAAPRFRPIDDDEQLQKVRAGYRLPRRFLLSVGSLEPGKNRGRIMLALRSLLDAGATYVLAIVGQPAWRYQAEMHMTASLGLQDHVRFLGYVPDDDMPSLYSAATALIFPSLYEGFGLPVVEAMACGTPVVTSAIGATAEVGDGAAVLVDPRNIEEIASAIRNVVEDDRLRSGLRERGLARSREFSWERTARETLAVYRKVMART